MSTYTLETGRAEVLHGQLVTDRDDLAPLRKAVSDQVDAAATALKEDALVWALNGVWNTQIGVQIQSTQMRAAAATQTLRDIINLHLQKQADMVVQTAEAADNMPPDMNKVADPKKVGP